LLKEELLGALVSRFDAGLEDIAQEVAARTTDPYSVVRRATERVLRESRSDRRYLQLVQQSGDTM
jgi:hypothetical protein